MNQTLIAMTTRTMITAALALLSLASAPLSAQTGADSTWYRIELNDGETLYGTLSRLPDGSVEVATERGIVLITNPLDVRRSDEIPTLSMAIPNMKKRQDWTIERRSGAALERATPAFLRGDTLYFDNRAAIPLDDVGSITISRGSYVGTGLGIGLGVGALGGLIYATPVVAIFGAFGIRGGASAAAEMIAIPAFGGAVVGALIGALIPDAELIEIDGASTRVRLAELSRIMR